MAYIRFNRHSTADSDGWVWDCFITTNGEVNGEFHNFNENKHKVFQRQMPSVFFVNLEKLLDQLPVGSEDVDTKGMVIVQMKEGGRKVCHSLAPLTECSAGTMERNVWEMIYSVVEGSQS